jgi:hypothetical protein
MIEAVDQTLKVARAITIGVLKGFYIQPIQNGLLVPRGGH